MTDADAIAVDKAALNIQFAKGDSAKSVTKNLILQTTGENSTSISWSSDTGAVISNDGTVSRPTDANNDATLKLLLRKMML